MKNRIQINQKQHHSSFIQLKKQYQKINIALKSVQKNLEKKKKDYQQAIKSRDKYKVQAVNYKSQHEKNINKINQYEYNLKNKDNQRQNLVLQYKLKLSEQDVKMQELLKIINYKNNNVDQQSIRQSLRGSQIALIVTTCQIGINTQPENRESVGSKIDQTNKKSHIDLELFLKKDSLLKKDENYQTPKVAKKEQTSNLFFELENIEPNNNDNFQICQEGQSVNIGRTQQNLRIKQLFNKLRIQIQKVLNGQDPSLSILRILPVQLEDDYNQLLSYIKEKVYQIRNMNQISFINVVVGNQPDCSQTSLDLPDLLQRNSQLSLKKLIQQKQAVINSLMAQKTQQQNTINQLTLEKEQIEQENENRFMNQCNIYKKQIKEHKKTLDILQMNYQSMKNLLKNICEIWISDDDNEEDFRDNMELYIKVAKLSQRERSRINFYLSKYKEMKGLQ